MKLAVNDAATYAASVPCKRCLTMSGVNDSHEKAGYLSAFIELKIPAQ
jgi:hypothetical protein